MLKNITRPNGKVPGHRAEQIVSIDRSDETIVIVCNLCAWRTASDDEIPARRDLVIHIFHNHQEQAATPGSDRRAVINTKSAHMKWLARRGITVVLLDIKNL